jgi:hypothetical protein
LQDQRRCESQCISEQKHFLTTSRALGVQPLRHVPLHAMWTEVFRAHGEEDVERLVPGGEPDPGGPAGDP